MGWRRVVICCGVFRLSDRKHIWWSGWTCEGKVTRVNFALEEATKAQRGEERHSSILSLTSALDWVGGQCHAPAALPPGKRPVTHCIRGRGAPGTVWMGAENLAPPPGLDPRTVQPVTSRCTDWAICEVKPLMYRNTREKWRTANSNQSLQR